MKKCGITVGRVILVFSILFSLYSFMLQVLPGSITNELIRDFQISATQFGLVCACFYLTYVPLQLLMGRWVDRYDAVLILVWMWLLGGVGTILFSRADHFYSLFLARLMIGAASAGAYIVSLRLGATNVSREKFSIFAGFLGSVGALGGILSTEVMVCWLRIESWRRVTWTIGIVGVVCGGLVWYLRTRSSRVVEPQQVIETKNTDYNQVLGNKVLWMVGVYSFCIWGPALVFASVWGSQFLQLRYQIDNVLAVCSLSWIWWGVAIFSLGMTWLVRYVGLLKLMLFAAVLGLGVISWIIFGNWSLSWLKVGMLLLGGSAAGQTLSFVMLKQIVSDKVLGLASGFINMWVVLGGLILPFLVGQILDLLWKGGWVSDGVRSYGMSNFRHGLAILPVCYLVAMGVIMGLMTITRSSKR